MATRPRPGKVRIIAGRWRGSVLPVLSAQGLRPTADRNRERLFNWLTPYLAGAHCLDLYAGSGALGLEALSRGAASCTLVEKEARVAAGLRDVLGRLQATDARVEQADALLWLRRLPPRPWDIVFLDPPFASDLLAASCAQLARPGHLKPGSLVYIEQARDATACWPADWCEHRRGGSRDAQYHLLRVGAVA